MLLLPPWLNLSLFLSNSTNLQSLDLSTNQISEEIPPEIQFFVNLAMLNVSSDRLSRENSQQLALCAYLNIIDLHDNQLSGTILQQLGLLARLSAFDVSNNKLSGLIPTYSSNRIGNFPRFNVSLFMGNRGLYGFPLHEIMKNKGLSVIAIVGIGLGCGIATLMITFTGVCIWLRITEKKIAEEEGKISQSMHDY